MVRVYKRKTTRKYSWREHRPGLGSGIYTERVEVRLTPAEKMAFQTACANRGVKLNAVIRRLVMDFVDADARSRKRKHEKILERAVRREAARRGELVA